jgi:pimeloyl-ACP methyl ester carboxylesterase
VKRTDQQRQQQPVQLSAESRTPMNPAEISEHTITVGGHSTFYRASGPEDGPLVIMCHGWPEQSLSWRHQLPVFGGLGFRAVAPDMRGYGNSSAPAEHEAYGLEHIVEDMLNLLNVFERESAIWVGHDWGSAVVWSMASHHPEKVQGVASLNVPYFTIEQGFDNVVDLVDREVYPEEQFPVGQWDYMKYYEENFDRATQVMNADPYNMVKALFRKGNPEGVGKPSITSGIRAAGGWFDGAEGPPNLPRDEDVVSEDDVFDYAAGLERNGFFGPNSWYMNHEANEAYAESAVNEFILEMPVLFLAGRYDFTCESTESELAHPMYAHCQNLMVHTVESGHWMAQEKPREVSAALADWIATQLPASWPTTPDATAD